MAARLARHAHEALQAETGARDAALASRWPLSALRTREADRLETGAATAMLLQDAFAALTGELRAANARIERLEQTLAARGSQVMAALLDRLLAARLESVRHDTTESRTALDGRMNALEAALDDRLSWLSLDLDALEVRVRDAARPQDRSREDPAG